MGCPQADAFWTKFGPNSCYRRHIKNWFYDKQAYRGRGVSASVRFALAFVPLLTSRGVCRQRNHAELNGARDRFGSLFRAQANKGSGQMKLNGALGDI
jgi:hypothetical protein